MKRSRQTRSGRGLLEMHIEDEPDFLTRCRENNLNDKDLNIVCQALELSGTAGMSLEVFAAKLRLLVSEMGLIMQKHESIKRSWSIGQANKRGTFLESVVMTAGRSAKTAIEVLKDPEISKSAYEREQEELEMRSADEKCLNHLLERGYRPQNFVKIVYVTGHRVPKEKLEFEGYNEVEQNTGFTV